MDFIVGVVVGLMLVAAGLLSYWITTAIENRDVRKDAVKRGFAKWVADRHGYSHFVWEHKAGEEEPEEKGASDE